MKTKAVRLYGQNDIRLEEFELPAITEEEVLIFKKDMDMLSGSIMKGIFCIILYFV